MGLRVADARPIFTRQISAQHQNNLLSSICGQPALGRGKGSREPLPQVRALRLCLTAAAASGGLERGGGAAQLLLSHIANDLEAAWHRGW